MQNKSLYFITGCVTFILFACITFYACIKPDYDCDNVICLNGGVCNTLGYCKCKFEYEGENCQTLKRDTYLGKYNGRDCRDVGKFYDMNLYAHADDDKINISNVLNTGKSSYFTITPNGIILNVINDGGTSIAGKITYVNGLLIRIGFTIYPGLGDCEFDGDKVW